MYVSFKERFLAAECLGKFGPQLACNVVCIGFVVA